MEGPSNSLLIRGCEVAGRIADVRIVAGRISALGRLETTPGEPVLNGRGGALLPGLHDHHLHLLSLAASLDSVRCGPPEVRDVRGLQAALGAATEKGWIRGVGYHESVAGDLDRRSLDRFISRVPARLQYRNGARWVLNTAAVEALGLDNGLDVKGLERDPQGRATGRLHRLDGWLRERLPQNIPPLAPVGQMLSKYGVTGATDATPDNGPEALRALEHAVQRGEIALNLRVMGMADLPEAGAQRVCRGEVKILLEERALPRFEDLVEKIRRVHQVGRCIAVHCVTRTELVVATTAIREAGAFPGDRVEHAAIASPDLVELLVCAGVAVVTQPNFVRERGDQYLCDVEKRDLPWLYRCAGLESAGVPVGGGTDAPFGDPDPWLAMQAAVDRRTQAGAELGREEAVTPERALELFTTPLSAPGGRPRRVHPGVPADLCLLSIPWRRARDHLAASDVVATLVAGRVARGKCELNG